MVETNHHVAERLQQGWEIRKKDKYVELIRNVDLANTTFWDAETKTLDISTINENIDGIKFNTTLPTLAITAVTQANPAVVTVSGVHIEFLKNGDSIDITGVVGMTELNGNTYTIANINYTNNTFELSGTNSTGFSAYTSGGTITFTNGIFEPRIEKIIGIKDSTVLIFTSKANESPIFYTY